LTQRESFQMSRQEFTFLVCFVLFGSSWLRWRRPREEVRVSLPSADGCAVAGVQCRPPEGYSSRRVNQERRMPEVPVCCTACMCSYRTRGKELLGRRRRSYRSSGTEFVGRRETVVVQTHR
jgi:hypothetical protein